MKYPANLCTLPQADRDAIQKHRDECLRKYYNRLETAKLWLKTMNKGAIRGKLAQMKSKNPVEAEAYRVLLNQLSGK
jgi:ribosomal protein L19E